MGSTQTTTDPSRVIPPFTVYPDATPAYEVELDEAYKRGEISLDELCDGLDYWHGSHCYTEDDDRRVRDYC
jgi:hypothetical protein